jgi:hypothetical protein
LVRRGGGASHPVAHLDLHGRLREVLAPESESITIVERAHEIAINGPLDVTRRPVNGVRVPGSDGVRDIVVHRTVVGRGVSLSKEVALHGRVRRTQPFPINLVEVIGFENETADDASARGRSYHRVDLSEEDVFGAGNGGRVRSDVDRELRPVGSISQGRSRRQRPVRADTRRPVRRLSCAQGWIGGARCAGERIAVCVCLRVGDSKTCPQQGCCGPSCCGTHVAGSHCVDDVWEGRSVRGCAVQSQGTDERCAQVQSECVFVKGEPKRAWSVQEIGRRVVSGEW